MRSFIRSGALSLAALTLLSSSVAAEVFEKLSSVPNGMSHFRWQSWSI